MSRYAAAHIQPQGPGDARPTALQIIKDEGAEGKLKGQVIVITGTSSGIGIETVRALAATGATLFLTARDLTKAETALDGIYEPSRMNLVLMDQESLASIRSAAATILAKTDKIHVLVNNAGIMAVPDLRLTQDGHELQFGTNHLAHFLFFQLLKPALLAGASATLPSRVVNVSSSAHNTHGINESGNYSFEQGGYEPQLAYGQSKTANIYMANEIDRRYGARHLHATSLHPGLIMTGLSKFIPASAFEAAKGDKAVGANLKTPEQGAATTVWAAVGQEWADKGGKFLSNCAVAEPGTGAPLHYSTVTHAAHAYDAEKEGRLWRDSLKLVGLADEE